MRCAIGTFTTVAFAITIAGCGDVSHQENLQSNDRAGQSISVEYSPASSPTDAAEPVVGHSSDDVASETPASARTITPTKHGETRPVEREPAAKPNPIEPRHTEHPKPQYQLRAGKLTAGSIDDHAKYNDFRNYLSNTLQNRAGASFPTLNIGRRIVIRVTNGQGEGIGDAFVTIHSSINGQQSTDAPLFSTKTASDGRALFLSARDTQSNQSQFQLTVKTPGSQQPITRQVSLDQPAWNVILDDTQPQLPTRLDLALVIDTTGSMQDELNYLKVEIDDIAAAVKQRFPNVEQRFALILYRDEGDEYVTRTFDFTGSLTEFRQKLSQQSANGGGDYPEAMHLALEQAGRLSWQAEETARVLFLVGDAPPHSRFATRTITAVDALREKNVKLFPVAASGVRDEAEWIMRSAAFLTMGRYLFLTDHSGVGNPHAKPQAPSYAVERLNALMVRMIASELAGRELLPSDIIATEGNASTLSPQLDQSVTQQQFAFPRNFPPAHSASHARGASTAFVEWLYEWIQLPATRIIAALLAVTLIWKLDTRRRCATTKSDELGSIKSTLAVSQTIPRQKH